MHQIILGGYVFGIGSALISCIVLGNYSMGMQLAGKMYFITPYLENGDKYEMLIYQAKTEPLGKANIKNVENRTI